jgi:hypothetical protein
MEGLFGFCKGWFIYTPMMFLAVLGLFFVKKHARSFWLPLLIFIPLNIYIILSWWSWWYGGGFGLRAFIESEAPLSICLAALIAEMFSMKNKILKIAAFVPIVFFVYLNLFQIWQYKKTLIRWNGMTEEMYWRVFLRKNVPATERDEIFKLAKEPTR